ncbi:hypothetical protein [Microvirga sp. VF16]|uniref:hypothetical protein n=1 Tax=Microvirga sp. VF16 TaxID=2807101 RepID=UPI00193D3D83|nr:hypothetical protein [Microvirga sp. VF16]QRM32539.1 hypothetical protein JO965_31110 [Microvirga sp. VF16]
MAPIAIVEHQLPGRARLRVSSKRGDAAWFASVIQALSRHLEIDELSADPRTGSILIRHQEPADLLELLATETSLFEIASSPDQVNPILSKDRTTAPLPELLDMTALGLFGLSAYQAARGQVGGTAFEHFWSSYGSARILRSPTLALGFAGLGFYQLMRGQLIGPAASLFYYALTLHHIAGTGGGDGSLPHGDGSSRSDPV